MPMLLCAICTVLTLFAAVIHTFVYPFGKELLSPLLFEILILLLPACLFLMYLAPDSKIKVQLRSVGFSHLRAEYVFLMIYTALFACSTSLILNFLLGGAFAAADGFTLFGIFTAGINEYTVSYPYLILVYAIVPAAVEEFVFRGVLFREFRSVGYFFAICLSTVISALFAFSPGAIVSTLFCSLVYCFIRHTTDTLQAAMLVHFAVNAFNLLMGTNIYRYFLSAGNRTLLLIILVGLWLLFTVLFCGEAARIYRQKGAEIAEGTAKSNLPTVDFKSAWQNMKAMLCHKPTMICGIVSLGCYAAVVVITMVF